MSRTITIASQKGGVGKTTTALNLGYCLGRFIAPTLVIDFDPQSGMTLASNLRNQTTKGLVDMLNGQCTREEVVAESRDGAVSVVGIGEVSPPLMQQLETAAWNGALSDAIKFLGEQFQYVVVDAPAGTGGIVHAALRASQSVLGVVDCHPLTLKSLPSLLALIGHVAAGDNTDLKLDGVLISKFDERSPTEREVRSQIFEMLPAESFFRTVVPFSEAFATASMEAVPVVLQPDCEDLARIYIDLAMELRERDLCTKNPSPDNDPARLF